jgi:hypothetical protein
MSPKQSTIYKANKTRYEDPAQKGGGGKEMRNDE